MGSQACAAFEDLMHAEWHVRSATHILLAVILNLMLLKRQAHVPSPVQTLAKLMALGLRGAGSELPLGDCP